MSDLAEPRQMTHGINHVVRRFPFRLVDDERAVDRRRLWLSRHSQLSVFGSSFAVLAFWFQVLAIGLD
jgi:hypothetical protein